MNKNNFFSIIELNKEKLLTIFSSLFSVFGSIITYRILLNYFDLSSVGLVGIVNTLSFLCILFFVGPISHSVLRFFNGYLLNLEQGIFLNTLLQVIKKELIVYFFITIVSSVIFYFFYGFDGFIIVLFGFLVSINSALISTIINFFESNRKRSFSLIIESTLPWFKISLIIALLLFFKKDVKLVFIAQFIATLIYLLLFFYIMVKHFNIKKTNEIDQELILRIKKYSYPYKYWGLPYWLYQSSDKYLLAYFSTTQSIGYYTILYQFTYTPITIIFGAIMKYIQPKIFQNSSLVYINKYFRRYVVFYMFILLTAVIFSQFFLNDFVSFLLGKKIELKPLHVIILILASGLYSFSDLFSIYFNILLKNNLLIPLKIISSLFGVVINFVFIYFFGLNGAIFSILIYTFFILIWIIRKKIILLNE